MINIIFWNVKGLLAPSNRLKILRHLKRLHADIALLQKTHLEVADFHRIKRLCGGQVIGSPSLGKKAGVLILIHKNLQGELGQIDRDKKGQMVTIRLTMRGQEWYPPKQRNKALSQNSL